MPTWRVAPVVDQAGDQLADARLDRRLGRAVMLVQRPAGRMKAWTRDSGTVVAPRVRGIWSLISATIRRVIGGGAGGVHRRAQRAEPVPVGRRGWRSATSSGIRRLRTTRESATGRWGGSRRGPPRRPAEGRPDERHRAHPSGHGGLGKPRRARGVEVIERHPRRRRSTRASSSGVGVAAAPCTKTRAPFGIARTASAADTARACQSISVILAAQSTCSGGRPMVWTIIDQCGIFPSTTGRQRFTLRRRAVSGRNSTWRLRHAACA